MANKNIRAFNNQESSQQRRSMPAAILLCQKAVAVKGFTDGYPFFQNTIGKIIGDRLFRLVFLEHPISAKEQNHAKEIENPTESLYNGDSQKDEYKSQNNGCPNTPASTRC